MTTGAHPESPAFDPRVSDALLGPDVGLRVIRGASIRAAGYGLGMALTAAGSVLLLRHLGVANFGRYMTVSSLVALVVGLTDGGLTAVGGRDLPLRERGQDRQTLLANLLGLRLALTPIGVAAALGFAVAAGYRDTLIVGTLLAGAGGILAAYQATTALPLSIDLRIGRLAASEAVKQTSLLSGIALLAAVGAGLLPFFGLSIGVAIVALVVTPILVGRGFVWRPAFDREEWRALIREAAPLTVSTAMGVFYFRLLIVIISLLASAVATGLFATSFRVIEILYAIGGLIATTALPVLAVVAADQERLGYILQRMTEGAVIGACYLALVVSVVAEPVLVLLGGSDYRGAAPILRIQLVALIPVFVTYVWQLTLIAVRRQSSMMLSNAVALAVAVAAGVSLIPIYGAKGAAVAAVAAEFACAFCLAAVLGRVRDAPKPDFRFLWKPALASGAGFCVAFPSGLSVAVAAGAATVVFAAVLAVTRAIPAEIVDALLAQRNPKGENSR